MKSKYVLNYIIKNYDMTFVILIKYLSKFIYKTGKLAHCFTCWNYRNINR